MAKRTDAPPDGATPADAARAKGGGKLTDDPTAFDATPAKGTPKPPGTLVEEGAPGRGKGKVAKL